MNLVEIFILAVGLSMDAFAVAICKGLGMKRVTVGKSAIVGGYFGFFQALMPLVGYLAGMQFAQFIERFDHWIAFIMLSVIGGKMLYESFKGGESESSSGDLGVKTMLIMSVATSIDALMVGVTMAFLKVDILPVVLFIGVVTFILSAVGVWMGTAFGSKLSRKAEVAGGVILICIGLKIFVEHMFF